MAKLWWLMVAVMIAMSAHKDDVCQGFGLVGRGGLAHCTKVEGASKH